LLQHLPAQAAPAHDRKKPGTARPAERKARMSPRLGDAYATRAEAMVFADDLAARRDLDPAWVRATIGAARFLPAVPRLMLPPPPGTPKNWRAYRSRFIDATRIQAGVRFWTLQRTWLEQAERTYGVPAAIIVGIIGVETIYGQQMGNYRVIDALCTLSFDFPATHPRAAERRAFFRGELEQFLSLQSRTGNDPLAPLGSYAGAMGMPQFMPSSWVRFAVDFDGDGRIDLRDSPGDVIGSVANYFRAFDWKPGQPTHFAVQLRADADLSTLLAPDILPSFSAARLVELGADLDPQGRAHAGPLALIELQNGAEAPSFVAGTENFYAITRYNWSSYYAMAVIELGEAVAQALDQATAGASR
jgi:membrane-bound lytic murein transglycosylase B